MNNNSNFILRHASWIIIGLISILILIPTFAEIKTFMLIIISECLAIALSGLALFAFTKIDFIKTSLHGENNANYPIIGSVFLGVHMLVGLVILGVYIAQVSI